MNPTIPEKNKKAGVCYAVADNGLELPVIDITHPAFAVDVSAEEVSALIDESIRNMEAAAKQPPEMRRAVAESSLLVRGWVEAVGTFMTGMMTYLNRLGPDNLGDGYAGPIDRRLAASIAPLSFRFRLRDLSRSIADGLAPVLAANPGRPVHLINIGGGPSADSLNGLILLNKEHPEWLAGRTVSIDVLDLDSEGPSFGASALAALTEPGAPLGGLTATLRHLEYNWADPAALSKVLAEMDPYAAAAGSTEGGLFDYGSDEEIVANLTAMRDGAPADFVMTGSVVRNESTLDPRLSLAAKWPRPSIRYLGLDAFGRLANSSGWRVDRVIDSPFHHVVTLKKR